MAEQEQEDFYLNPGELPRGTVQSPPAIDNNDSYQLIKVLTDHEDLLDILKMQLRGEQLYLDERKERYMRQVEKPTFVKLDKYNKPIKIINPKTKQEEFVCNEEAVSELINSLKLCGLNPVAPMTTIDENEIRADLLEMESKWAVILAINRKKWGMKKEEYPVVVGNIKVLLKDTRYRSKDGVILKALRTITSRIEQSHEKQKNPGVFQRIKSPFS